VLHHSSRWYLPGNGVTNSLLTQLWTNLKYPSLLDLEEDSMYRRADGSKNTDIL
jgi:hypothetical protein